MDDKDYYRLYEKAFSENNSKYVTDRSFGSRVFLGKKFIKKESFGLTLLLTKAMRKEKAEERITLFYGMAEAGETVYSTLSSMGTILEQGVERGVFNITAAIKSNVCDNIAVLNVIYLNGTAAESSILARTYSKELLPGVHTAKTVLEEFKLKITMRRG